jgi:hypothetical protein
MALFRWIFAIVLLLPAGTLCGSAQQVGSLDVSGRVKIAGKQEKFLRKRFYLLSGGLEANKPLIERMKAAPVVSRECFYCAQKASPQFIDWLRTGDCESPYCRTITAEEAKAVPEFQAAYQKGLKSFRNKSETALEWLTTNLAPGIRDGFYRQRKSAVEAILATAKPVQSSMTDSVNVKAIFIDIPLVLPTGKTTQPFIVSNIVPIEFAGKSYLWACEVQIGSTKKAVLNLTVPEPGKTVKNCEVIVKDLPPCGGGSCPAK